MSRIARGKHTTPSFSCARLMAKTIRRGDGMSVHDIPEYSIYHVMKRRCYDTKLECYERYGARGIRVCERWLESFWNFYADMGPRPSPKHSIDRINTNGDYEPSNCRWATPSQQAINRVWKNKSTGHTGIHYRKKTKRFLVSLSVKKKRYFIGSFDCLESAIKARKDAEEKYHRPVLTAD